MGSLLYCYFCGDFTNLRLCLVKRLLIILHDLIHSGSCDNCITQFVKQTCEAYDCSVYFLEHCTHSPVGKGRHAASNTCALFGLDSGMGSWE